MMRAAVLILSLALWGCGDRNPHRSGTVEGPLRGDRAISLRASGGETLSALDQDGLRVLIKPSFGRYSYYLSLRQLPAGCVPRARRPHDGSADARGCGPARVEVRRIDQTNASIATARFFLPPEEGDMLLERLDAQLARWNGDNSGGTDGTGIDFERVRDGRTTSMSSNSYSDDPGNPAVALAIDLHRALLAYGPRGLAPRSWDWHVARDDESGGPCETLDLATPLDQGFGVGDSPCDAAKRWP